MAPAPDSQLIKFDEATVLAKNWRSGLDSHPHSRVIEKEITNLLYRELDLFQLHVDDSSDHKFSVLTIQRALKEGETALVASSLVFSTVACLQQFLQEGSNGALLEGASLFKLRGLRDTNNVETELFTVSVGAARFVADYRSFP